ncbi:hypothetical protein AURDEDRAFT_164489 [Auricularia subglabra TFB-10046 SS5]|nr:hypothetical protein AURDEDRAFT_164489 [Auricularia subglabra TFB-10046 SS5]
MYRASSLLGPKPPHTSGTYGFIVPTRTSSGYAEAVVLDYSEANKTYTLAAFLGMLDDPPRWLVLPDMPRERFGVDPCAPVPRMRGARCMRAFWDEARGRRRAHEAIVLDLRREGESGERYVLDIAYRCNGLVAWQVERGVDGADIILYS